MRIAILTLGLLLLPLPVVAQSTSLTGLSEGSSNDDDEMRRQLPDVSLVFDGDDRLLGIFTERDYIRVRGETCLCWCVSMCFVCSVTSLKGTQLPTI